MDCKMELEGELAKWSRSRDWDFLGNASRVYLQKEAVCGKPTSALDNLYILPAHLNYAGPPQGSNLPGLGHILGFGGV